MVAQLVVVFLAGGCGAAVRFGCYALVESRLHPLATLAVNIAGALAMGWAHGAISNEWLRLGVMTGFLGGLTTFSALALDVISRSSWSAGLALLGAHTIVGLIAAWCGWMLGR